MFQCMECGKRFRHTAAAERASVNGCPGCGGVDIDLADPSTDQKRRNRKRLHEVLDPILNPPICAGCGGYHEVEDCPDRLTNEELEAAAQILDDEVKKASCYRIF